MNDEPKSPDTASATLELRHEKVIVPINPDVRPEVSHDVAVPNPDYHTGSSPVQTPVSVPEQSLGVDTHIPIPSEPKYDTSNPTTGSLDSAQDGAPFNSSRFQFVKILKLIIAGIVGCLVGASYFHFWENTAIGNLTILVTEQHSPFVIRHTILPMVILIVVYALLFKFVLKSKHSAGQAVFATTTTLILVVGILALNHRESVNIFGSGTNVFFYISGMVGACVFAAANYFSEKVWTWKTSRFALGIIALSMVTASVFALGKVVNGTLAKDDRSAQEISDKVGKESAAGIYNFNADYQQFLPNETTQNRFIIKDISATSVTQSKEHKSYPHFTHLEFRDKNYTGTNDVLTIGMWQSKTSPSYHPPANCGHPDPSMEYYDQKSSRSIYKGECYKVSDISGVGILYGRNEYRTSEAHEKNTGTYDWYYIKYKDTFITLNTTKTLSGSDVGTLLAGLSPVSTADLLAKSKALAQGIN